MPKNTVHTGASIEGLDGETEMLGASTVGAARIGENDTAPPDVDTSEDDDENTPKKAARVVLADGSVPEPDADGLVTLHDESKTPAKAPAKKAAPRKATAKKSTH